MANLVYINIEEWIGISLNFASYFPSEKLHLKELYFRENLLLYIRCS